MPVICPSIAAVVICRYMGAKTLARFERSTPVEIPQVQLDTVTSGLALVLEYDGRDNIFTPNNGIRASLVANKFSPALGSDRHAPIVAAPGTYVLER